MTLRACKCGRYIDQHWRWNAKTEKFDEVYLDSPLRRRRYREITHCPQCGAVLEKEQLVDCVKRFPPENIEERSRNATDQEWQQIFERLGLAARGEKP